MMLGNTTTDSENNSKTVQRNGFLSFGLLQTFPNPTSRKLSHILTRIYMHRTLTVSLAVVSELNDCLKSQSVTYAQRFNECFCLESGAELMLGLGVSK